MRIVLVDAYALFREGLKEILNNVEDFTVVAEAGDAGQAAALVAQHCPDVVLLDVQMPKSNVRTTIEQIRRQSPQSRIIILSMYDDSDLMHSLVALGIDGYLAKSTTGLQLVSAIRASLDRKDHVVVSVPRATLALPPTPAAPSPLSPRELEVLTLAAQAMSNAQIARQLVLTEATVKRHLRNIFLKLDAVSRIDAVNKAVAAAFLPPPEIGGGDAPAGRDLTPVAVGSAGWPPVTRRSSGGPASPRSGAPRPRPA